MKLLIDVQSLQTFGSSKRGIGRYSLNILNRLLQTNTGNDIVLLINGKLNSPEGIQEILDNSEVVLGIREWYSPEGSAFLLASEDFSYIAKEVYKDVLREINPDVHLILSPFEGLGDEVIWAVESTIPSAAVFYDAIPFIYENEYLSEKPVRRWYESIVSSLKDVDGLISISESTKRDAESVLGLKPKQHITVEAGLDLKTIALAVARSCDDSAQIERKYIFSVLGEDFRKNKINLLRAFKLLTEKPNFQHNLHIAYKQSDHERTANIKLLEELHLGSRVFFLDYIDDEKLFTQYRNADLFVFPSFYEGLGLPILEAQASGVPVVGSNSSSLVELLTFPEFHFNPTNPTNIASTIEKILGDESLKSLNLSEGAKLVSRHSSPESGHSLWNFFGRLANSVVSLEVSSTPKTRLAFFTPFPPQKTGIATHAFELAQSLKKRYALTVFTEDLDTIKTNTNNIFDFSLMPIDSFLNEDHDILLFNVGNSQFHLESVKVLQTCPGIVILHDTYLSGLAWMELIDTKETSKFPITLYNLGGFTALASFLSKLDHGKILEKHALNSMVVEKSLGLVVHSQYAKNLIMRDFLYSAKEDIAVIPQQHLTLDLKDASNSPPSDFIVFATFGAIADTKMYQELLSAWKGSNAELSGNGKLYFVGEDLTYDIHRIIDDLSLGDSVKISGYTNQDQYDAYLKNVDIGIQLRQSSRGETSRALLDLFAAGKPVIINENGSFKEFCEYGVIAISDAFTVQELRHAINTLFVDQKKRKELGIKNYKNIRELHSPEIYLEKLSQIIDKFALEKDFTPEGVTRRISKVAHEQNFNFSINQMENLLRSVGDSFNHNFVKKKVFIDVTNYIHNIPSGSQNLRIRQILDKIAVNFSHQDIRFVITPDSGKSFLDYPAFLSNFYEMTFPELPVWEIDQRDVVKAFWPLSTLKGALSGSNFYDDLEIAAQEIANLNG